MDAQDGARLLSVHRVAEPMGRLVNDIHARVQQRTAAPCAASTERHSVEDMLALLRTDATIHGTAHTSMSSMFALVLRRLIDVFDNDTVHRRAGGFQPQTDVLFQFSR